ncbi:class I SAM-dependent methyltransferase [Brachybacterium timonense]|uniref:class I SAM-dependent methyltransferase n=1 Tax=Brachybacterium timonense TaxID=2050896 RepID=UPI000D0B3C81|nr:class I SAM-dependent methyltransferase [Brachybacterium timonense]
MRPESEPGGAAQGDGASADGTEPQSPTEPRDPSAARPIPRISAREQPRFGSPERRRQLAATFTAQGADYDRLRPGYPLEQIAHALAAAADPQHPGGDVIAPGRDAVDLGAGTGKLALALAECGLHVTAVDPSASMLAVARQQHEARHAASGPTDGRDAQHPARASAPRTDGGVRTVVATAEDTGLPTASADLVTAAQAWHWFDTEAASAEVRRLLRPGGVLLLLWNTMDVTVPWVHRYSRIMHAGDVQREDFTPPLGRGLRVDRRVAIRWEDPMRASDLVDLARTRSYVAAAAPREQERVLTNLRWYLFDHLGHRPEDVVPLPYRTDAFLCRPLHSAPAA